jgi:hypothetical protein
LVVLGRDLPVSRLPTRLMRVLRAIVIDRRPICYGPNLLVIERRVAEYVNTILKGAKPADLPVEQPIRFEMLINMKTAKALSLAIPQSVMLRADEVIE